VASRRILQLSFDKGLNQSQEASALQPGFAADLLNWEPTPTGGLRARRGWKKASTTGAPATRACVGMGYMSRSTQPGIVQQSDAVSGDSGAGTTLTLQPAWKAPTKTGALLVAVITIGLSSAAAVTFTDWTAGADSGAVASTPRALIYYIEAAASRSGPETIQLTLANNTAATAQLFEISGISLSSPLDRNATSTGSSVSPASGTTAATTRAAEYVIAVLADHRIEAQTSPTNSFQQLSETQKTASANAVTAGVYGKATTATAAQGVAVTTATSDTWAGAIATFKGWYAASSPPDRMAYFTVAHKGTTTYDLYAIDRANLASGTFGLLEQVAVADPSVLVAMTPGPGGLLYTSTQLATARRWDGETSAAITGAPAGRCIAFHKNMVFIGGTPGSPTRLWYSDIGTLDFLAANYFEIGQDDGEPLEDATPFDDGLLIGKENSLHYLLGEGLNTFQRIRLSAGGAAPGRSIMATPYGAVIAGTRDVWLYTGGTTPIRISAPIEVDYQVTGAWVSLSYWGESVYILDAGSGKVFVLHMPTGVWRIEEAGSSGEMPSCLYNQDFRQLYGPTSATVGSLLSYREFPHGARAKDFDTLSETFRAQTEEVWPAGPETAFTPMHLHLKVRQRGGDETQEGLTVTPIYDGQEQEPLYVEPHAAAGTYRERVDVGSAAGIFSASYRIEQTLSSGQASIFDIEEVLLELDLEEVR